MCVVKMRCVHVCGKIEACVVKYVCLVNKRCLSVPDAGGCN